MRPKFIFLTFLISIAQLLVLKLKFPFPALTGDSDNYILAASEKMGANIWPIGYSLFLRLVGWFSRSANFLVFVQVMMYAFCAIQLFSLMNNELRLNRTGRVLLYIILFCNPLVLLLNNLIMSDGVFLSLSIIWFVGVLTIFNQKKSVWFFIVHSFLVLVLFTFRYQAIIYPAISILVVVFFSKNRIWERMLFSCIVMIIFSSFILYTIAQNGKYTGVRQFSVFPGWQVANNALIAYAHVSPERRASTKLPPEFSNLHQYVNHYIDSTLRKPGHYDSILSTAYLWRDFSPLRKYVNDEIKYNHEPALKNYITMSKISDFYDDYGKRIIKQYPGEYLGFYIVENAKYYVIPPTEVLMQYRASSITPIERKWFYDTDWSKDKFDDLYDYSLEFINLFNIPILILFLGTTMVFLSELRNANKFLRVYFLISWVIIIANFFFLLLTTPIVLRYLIFNQIIEMIFIIYVISSVLKQPSKINIDAI